MQSGNKSTGYDTSPSRRITNNDIEKAGIYTKSQKREETQDQLTEDEKKVLAQFEQNDNEIDEMLG